jgi:hypothetical protein
VSLPAAVVIPDGETISNLIIVRGPDGSYGAHITCYASGFASQDIPCEHGTFEGLMSRIAGVLANAMRRKQIDPHAEVP